MGLFLSQQQMWDRPLGGAQKKGQIPHWAGLILFGVLAFLCKVLFRYRVDNRESLRGFKGRHGVVVVGNHTSFLDVVFMFIAGMPGQWTRFMGRDSLFGKAHGLLGWIISRVGAFPVRRDSADRTAIKRAARMLKDDEVVGIMPEGTRRSKSGKAPELHAGAALVAKMGNAPLLPMTVRDAEKVKQKGQRLRFPKVTVEYGSPVLLSDFDFVEKADRLEACSWYVMRECFALFYRTAPEQVDMAELFPDTRDYAPLFAEHPIPRRTTAEVLALLEVDAA